MPVASRKCEVHTLMVGTHSPAGFVRCAVVGGVVAVAAVGLLVAVAGPAWAHTTVVATGSGGRSNTRGIKRTIATSSAGSETLLETKKPTVVGV